MSVPALTIEAPRVGAAFSIQTSARVSEVNSRSGENGRHVFLAGEHALSWKGVAAAQIFSQVLLTFSRRALIHLILVDRVMEPWRALPGSEFVRERRANKSWRFQARLPRDEVRTHWVFHTPANAPGVSFAMMPQSIVNVSMERHRPPGVQAFTGAPRSNMIASETSVQASDDGYRRSSVQSVMLARRDPSSNILRNGCSATMINTPLLHSDGVLHPISGLIDARLR